MPVFLGLDCGGSSTRALAFDGEGALLHQGQGGPANVSSNPERRVRMSLATAVKDCPEPDFVCGCFAGLLTPDDRERAIRYLKEIFPAACVHAEPDFAAALYASEPGTDICIIAGTGSLVCSRYEGRVVKSGGRGYILGDQGSAFQFGRDALRAYLALGDQASDELKGLVAKVLEFTDEPRLISKLYRSASPQALLGKLAKAVASDHHAGFPYAEESLARNSDALAEVIQAHVQKYHQGASALQLSLVGGLWQMSAIFKERFVACLSARLPGVEINAHRIKQPPVMGAVQLARELKNGN